MVNMNAADDKENNGNSDIVAEEATPSSSSCMSGAVPSQVKQNGTDCSKHSITNGAYPKVNVLSQSTVNGPSCSRKYNTQDIYGDTNNLQTISSNGRGSEQVLKNDLDCHQKKDQPCVNNSSLNSRVTFDYDKNSSSEDEECCIYTYKGDSKQMADLPSSFFRIMPRPDANSRNSSPDMDYFEMDFDPGPSNDRYSSESGSECDENRSEERFVAEAVAECLPVPESPVQIKQELDLNTSPSPLSTPSPVWPPLGRQSSPELLSSPALRSPPPSPVVLPDAMDGNSTQPQTSCYCIANRLISRLEATIDENLNEGDAGTMVWKEKEAKEKQVTQIATSACGATAVINALVGLNVQFTVASVKQHVATRLRADTALLPEYLLSRCHAGATHTDLIRGLHGASHDTVYARFFHMYPQRILSLSSWLSYWIRKGAVPILTRNLQRNIRPGTEMPDSWHHQMVYGISAAGVHLTNPLEVESEARLWAQLSSPSELKVRREDVLSRWTPDTFLHPLAHPSLPLWRKMNVLGQVVNVIREGSHCSQPTQHITIPASYCSGVTLAVLRSSPAYDDLRLAPELPIDPFASS